MQPVTWHSIESDETLRRLESSASGLNTADAQKRLSEYGPNTLPEKRRRSLLAMLLGQFSDFMVADFFSYFKYMYSLTDRPL